MNQVLAAGSPAESGSRIEREIERARGLLEKNDFAQALALAESLLADVPENRDALYVAAVSQRYLKRFDLALATLTRLEALHPDYGRLFQERGHCYRALGDVDNAIAAYERAVALNAALPASWRSLLEHYRLAGRAADVERTARQVAHLSTLPPALVSASSLMNEGNLYKAERLCRQFLQTHGHHLEGMRLLAELGVRLDVLDDAEFLLESCVEFAPDHHAARYDYALVLSRRQKHDKALEQAAMLCKVDPANRAFRTLYATECVGVGDQEAALRIYRTLLEDVPHNPEVHLSIGHALKTLGCQLEAIEAYRTAFAQRPDYGDAYWSLANLKTYRFADDELARMRALEERPATAVVDRCHLCFALGKAYEDRCLYCDSFAHYERGNALKQSELRYNPDLMERNLRLQAAVCTAEFFAARTGSGCDRQDPIFIVGLPRAGSTLLEQILASHSKVEGTMELHNILELVHRLDGRRRITDEPNYPACLAALDADRLRQLGEQYIADTQIYRKSAAFFIDKMPNNFRHIGLIHLILPNAKIIDARRDAMACCFSGFKQLFAAGQEFTYGLESIGRYYRSYVDLMAHWDAVLPGKILRVQYEDVVADLEDNVRRVLDFCGLDFEPACVAFHKTTRSVRTASSEQVRQPIFREGLDQWRNYEPYLGPLKAALGPLAARA